MALASTYCLVIDLDLPKELHKLCHSTEQFVGHLRDSREQNLFNCFQSVRIGFHGKPHVDLFMQNKFIKNNNTSRDSKTVLDCAKK